MILRNIDVVTPTAVIRSGYIAIDERGFIADVGVEPYKGPVDVYEDLGGYIAIPGFVDTHIHGIKGLDITSDPSPETILEISRRLIEYGVTSFLPTTVSAPFDVLLNVCRAVNVAKRLWRPEDGARILGLHLEGPFINKDMAGAHSVEHIRKPSISELNSYIEASGNSIAQITIAPEVENAIPFISYARGMGITVSIGHTNASYEQGVRAIEAGATKATHIFNAMRGIHHRDPGVAVALLESPNVFLEVIADGVHLHPSIVRLLLRFASSDRVVLVTDSIAATGMPDGVYSVGDIRIRVEGGVARIAGVDRLAGSTLTMDRAFRNAVDMGFSLVDAVKIVSTTPARSVDIVRRARVGAIERGYRADIVILSKSDLRVRRVYIDGRLVYEK